MIRTKINYRQIWENHHECTIPEGSHVHHIDGDSHNNDISNLMVCSKEEHAKLHEDMGQPWSAAFIRNCYGSWKGVTGKDHFNYGRVPTDELRALWSKQRSGKRNSSYNPEILNLTNDNGETLSATRLELKTIHKFHPRCLSRLIKGEFKTYRGWRLV